MARCIESSVHLFSAYIPFRYASWAATSNDVASRQLARRRCSEGGCAGEPASKLVDDGRGNLVLNREDVREIPIETLGPQLIAVLGVDELCCDAHAVPGLANAALERGADSQSPADLGDVEILALKGERRGAGDDAQPGHSRQGVDDLLGDAVTEVLLILLADSCPRTAGRRSTMACSRVGRRSSPAWHGACPRRSTRLRSCRSSLADR